MDFCEALRMLRGELGLTQTEFASELHVSFASISRWELGKTHPARSILTAMVDYAYAKSVSKECISQLKNAIAAVKAEKLNQAPTGLNTVEVASLRGLIDDASFPIYVCDIDTNDLLYLNHKAESMFGGTLNQPESRKCYKRLMNLDAPCSFCRREQLVADRFTSFDAFRPDDGVFHRVNGKLIRWNGHDAQIRYILNVGDSINVTEQSAREIAYNEQLRLRRQFADDAVASASFNMTHNSISGASSKRERWVSYLSTHTVDEVLHTVSQYAYAPDQVDKIKEICDRQAMIRSFYVGKTHISIKHSLSNDRSHCFETTFDLMQSPITYDIEAFCVTRDITDAAVSDGIVEKLLKLEYETIMTIDAATGEPHPFTSGHISDVITEQKRVGDNVAGVEAYLRKHCDDDDVDRVIRETSLPYVKEQLETKDIATCTYSLKENGKIRHKRVIYSYIGETRSAILCAMQDLTDTYHEDVIQRDRLSSAMQTLQEVGGLNVARYDLKTKTFYSNCDITSDLGYGDVIENVPDTFINDGHVAPESVDEFRTFYENLCAGKVRPMTSALEVIGGKFHWFHANAKIINDEYGMPYQAIIVFQDVEQRREQATIYETWRQAMDRRSPNDYTLFRSNLSRGAAFDRVEGRLLNISFTPNVKSFNERVAEYAGRSVHMDDFVSYVSMLNADKLLADYTRGIHTSSLVYRERVTEGEYRWLRVSSETTKAPGSPDIEVLLLYEKAEPDMALKRDERNIEKAKNTAYENTGLLLVRCDWESKAFIYDADMSKRILGRYDGRPIWEVFLADRVAEARDVAVFKDYIDDLAKTPGRVSCSLEMMLKTPELALHPFVVYAFRQNNGRGEAEGIVLTFLDVNEDVAANKRLHFRAEHDELTGLYNRVAFLRLLKDAVSKKPAGYYVLFCSDINDFRYFNERYGREEGDRLLRFSAEKLLSSIKDRGGFAGRMSNDVFAFLLPNTPGLIDKVTAMIRVFYHDYPIKAKLTGRAGSYIVNDIGISVDSMLDSAMTAKDSIKGKYARWVAVFDGRMNEKRLREKEIADKMETALADGQFDVYLQPQFHHANGLIVGAEALVRWIDPQRGVIPPDEFIPLFEKNGFITQLDEYVWELTARYMSEWMAQGHEPVPTSVNVSREDLNDPGLCVKLLEIVRKHNVPAAMFRLEITESIFAEDPKHMAKTVGELHDAGFIVEMDDFGSGYSSLNILKDVPVDILKLDMRFFSEDENPGRGGMIISSVLRMSRWLNIPVIAEGVEQKHQADFLLSVGCPTIQGYLYEKPMPRAEFERMLLVGGNKITVPQDMVNTQLDTTSFWASNSPDSQLFNNYIGPAVIFEYHNGKYEIVRMSRRFVQTMGIQDTLATSACDMVIIADEDKLKFKTAVLDAMYMQEIRVNTRFILAGGETLETKITLRMIAKSTDRALFFATMEI